ncbi:Mlp family protein (plasmid) [Borrelia hermsii]|uniref:Mlp family lipoprotein n=1 Tax=Borrelia hermsii TaxID=140 RepID=UPI0021ADC520|nr:Mlp family lipoprotein [Borrelia hermsii]UVY98935.1 Mlp family protein [Borrelia hermsii]
MSKLIRFMLFGAVLLYCCKGYKVRIAPTEDQSHSSSKRAMNNLHKETDEIKEKAITLTDDERKKFNSLKHALEKVVEKLQNQIQGCQNDKSKCTSFLTWLSKDIPKQKELANAFTDVYNFLEKKRQEKASDKDFDTYISDAIDCQAGNNDGKYGNGTNEIEQFFRGILNDIPNKSTNKEMFECLKDGLTSDNSHWGGLKNWE